MIDLIILLLVNAFHIAGLHLATRDGMIFGMIQYLGLPIWIENPLFDCPTCMASIHGSYVFLIAANAWGLSYWLLLLYIPVLAGVSTLVWRAIDSLRDDDSDPWSV